MKIVVGSLRESKIEATRKVLSPFFPDAEVSGCTTDSGVREQPLTLEEIVAGARNRAQACFAPGVDLGVGLEGGVFQAGGGGRYYQLCAAAIWDGILFSTGLSPAFELPDEVGNYLRSEESDLNQALHSLGYTDDLEIGHREGAVGLFTGGRLGRIEYMAEALKMAYWVKIGHARRAAEGG